MNTYDVEAYNRTDGSGQEFTLGGTEGSFVLSKDPSNLEE